MIFLFPRWDMLIPWRVFFWSSFGLTRILSSKSLMNLLQRHPKIWIKAAFRSTLFELTGGGFKDFLFSHPTWGRFPIFTNIFQGGWNHQLESNLQVVHLRFTTGCHVRRHFLWRSYQLRPHCGTVPASCCDCFGGWNQSIKDLEKIF